MQISLNAFLLLSIRVLSFPRDNNYSSNKLSIYRLALLQKAELRKYFLRCLPVCQVSQSIDVSGFLEMFLVSLLVLGYMSAVITDHQPLNPTVPTLHLLSFHELIMLEAVC